MTDDIVTRLRDLQLSSNQLWEIDVCKAMTEAADEIERLREEIRKQTCCQDAADEIERLRSENKQLQADLAMARKWRDNFKLAWLREKEGRRSTLMSIDKENDQ